MSVPARPDRRALIVEAAIGIVSARGVRALSHGSIDAALELPKGSTSYYYRTRHSLLEAITTAITTRSRDDFVVSGLGATAATPPAAAARAVAGWLHDLLEHRAAHVIARYALVIELAHDAQLHPLLARSLFSRSRAEQLFEAWDVADPTAAAVGFVSVVEGVVFDHALGTASLDATDKQGRGRIDDLARPLEAYLVGVLQLDKVGRKPRR
jgi:DNA-binding transcriptional regulator YbjK